MIPQLVGTHPWIRLMSILIHTTQLMETQADVHILPVNGKRERKHAWEKKGKRERERHREKELNRERNRQKRQLEKKSKSDDMLISVEVEFLWPEAPFAHSALFTIPAWGA